MKKLEKQLAENKVPTGARAHPRLVHAIVEQGSLADDSDIQDLWAGLLSSSCTPSGDDDSNLIFIDLLNGLTRLQAKILKYACEQAPKSLLPSGLIVPGPLPLSIADLRRITEEDDIHRLDRELDRLRTVGLLDGGIATNVRDYVNLTPSSLALQMYIRCQGSRVSPAEFFRSSPPHPSSAEPPNLAQ
jgi:hypothetical protein